MKIFISLAWTAPFIFFTGCSFDKEPKPKSTLEQNNLQYSIMIPQIEKRLASPGTWEDLFLDSDFIKLYENSATYIDSASAFMSNNNYTDQQKSVCIFSMQKAAIEPYLLFFDSCTTLFEKNNLSEDLLRKAISPNFGKRRPIIKNYENLYERKLLEKIQSGRNISTSFKSTIRDILSGTRYQQMREFYEGNGYDVNSMQQPTELKEHTDGKILIQAVSLANYSVALCGRQDQNGNVKAGLLHGADTIVSFLGTVGGPFGTGFAIVYGLARLKYDDEAILGPSK